MYFLFYQLFVNWLYCFEFDDKDNFFVLVDEERQVVIIVVCFCFVVFVLVIDSGVFDLNSEGGE